MTEVARYDVRAVGQALDRAVHRCVRTWWITLPFILVDSSGNLIGQNATGGAAIVLSLTVSSVLVNRARVVAAVSMSHARAGIAWNAVAGHFRSLAFVLISPLEFAAVAAVVMFFAVAAMIATRTAVPPAFASSTFAVTTAAVFLLFLTAAIAVVALLVALAGVAATIDTVVDGAAPVHALGRWLKQTFRRDGLMPTLIAALVLVVLVEGVPWAGSALPWGPEPVREALEGIPFGIADAVAFAFVWEWRRMILELRQGVDIAAVAGATMTSSASPTATSPIATTSQ